MIDVTFWPILAAGLASMLIGYIWYHPRVFGGLWMKYLNVTPEMAERAARRRRLYTVLALLSSMIIAYVMNYFGIAWGVFSWLDGIELGFWCWVGFVAPTLLAQVFWEEKRFALFLISVLYWLVSFIVMGIILTL
jgi:hypothetical protein